MSTFVFYWCGMLHTLFEARLERLSLSVSLCLQISMQYVRYVMAKRHNTFMLEISQIRLNHSSPSSLGILLVSSFFFQANSVMVTDSNSGFASQ